MIVVVVAERRANGRAPSHDGPLNLAQQALEIIGLFVNGVSVAVGVLLDVAVSRILGILWQVERLVVDRLDELLGRRKLLGGHVVEVVADNA